MSKNLSALSFRKGLDQNVFDRMVRLRAFPIGTDPLVGMCFEVTG